jgi:hypothetical protein
MDYTKTYFVVTGNNFCRIAVFFGRSTYRVSQISANSEFQSVVGDHVS